MVSGSGGGVNSPEAAITALARADRLPEAEAKCRLALAARPDDAGLLNLHGLILVQLGRPGAALAPLSRAMAIRPAFAPAANNLGVALERLGRPAEAAKAFRHAVEAVPSADIWFNLGNACRHARDVPGARDAYAQAVALAPQGLSFFDALIGAKRQLCDWDGLDVLTERLKPALTTMPDRVEPFRMLAEDVGEEVQQNVARHWAARFSVREGLAGPVAAKPKLTVGYVSADFQRHAIAHLIAELFELHDRARFVVNAYSLLPDDGSALRRRLTASFDSFVDCSRADDLTVARRMAADGVDILVDLQGYTRHARSQIAACRPAPVQVQWLGYPGTMAAPFMDYLLADGVVLPESSQPFYDEAIVRLPHCYQINDRKRPRPVSGPSRAALGLPEDGLVMACFNAPYKVRPSDFSAWMKLLRQVDDAVLWLYCDEKAAETNLRAAAEAHGISTRRLVFASLAGIEEHLARYLHVDLFLDTLPYNAHTTASDALWMGCPVVTRMGGTFAGRVGASLLHAVGLERLITRSAGEYQAVALRLLRDPAERHAIREHLTTNRLSLPLFDTPAVTRAVERAYDLMWERAVAGLPPRAFSV